jgi:hypothetical protein
MNEDRPTMPSERLGGGQAAGGGRIEAGGPSARSCEGQ